MSASLIDIMEMGLEGPAKQAVGTSHLVHDGAAGLWDWMTGDTEHAAEHAVEANNDALDLIPLPKPVETVKNALQTGKTLNDLSEPEEVPGGGYNLPMAKPIEHYDAGDDAGYGAMAAAAMLPILGGPMALAGFIGGGVIGELNRPTAEGGFIPGNLGAMAGSMAGSQGQVCLPGKPEPGPYDHYAD